MSPETQVLGDLLARFPRRTISQYIQNAATLDELLYALEEAPPKDESRLWAGKVSALQPDRTNQELIGFFDPDFPSLLREIPDPPLVLQVRGNRECLAKPSIAVVGARRCTNQGRALAEQFAMGLGRSGIAIVSGLALGIDTHAHKGALLAHAQTIACLGSGLNNIYPRSNERLAQRILSADGSLISEYSPDVGARPFHFPERNRLISGLCLGVLVVEASEKSGSLITARMALEQGRDVFALPGPVDSLVSGGCHRLIRDGAELITCSEQLIESLNLERDISRGHDQDSVVELSAEQRYLASLGCGYARTLDELMALSGWDAGMILSMLGELELLGIVRQSPDGYIATSLFQSAD